LGKNKFNFEYAAKTDIGKKRDHNEDAYGVYPEDGLFFVCDGMGGHAAGDYASQKVVETIILLAEARSFENFSGIVRDEPSEITFYGRILTTMVMLANRRLFRLAVMYPKLRGMGSTFTSVMFDEGYVNIVNVGDSRVYRLRDNSLQQLTVDHSWVEELKQDGEISENEVDNFRENNVITRAIGISPDSKIDWKGSLVQENDVYLLCSDGINGEISDDEITSILNAYGSDLDAAADALITAANNAGGSDNSTVILVRIKNLMLQPDETVAMDNIVTVSTDNLFNAELDRYIDRYFPLNLTEVPKGVEKERTYFYKSPIFIAVMFVLLIFGFMLLINQPWKETLSSVQVKQYHKGDILVRTQPAGADVKLYKDDSLVKRKISPADFLSLEVGRYRLEIEKHGYEKRVIGVVVKNKQKIINEKLLGKDGT
jgi:protein phosphatase